MKILYCYRYGILGGVCTQLINRLEALRDSPDFEAHLVFAKDMGISRTLAGYPHLHFEPEPQKVRAMALAGNFDAVVVIDTAEYLEAMSDLKDTPVITEVHTTTERGLEYLQHRNWKTAGYIVPSEYSRWMLRERFGVGRDAPVRVVPNSLDISLFPRVEIANPSARPIFAWVGKLDDHKNWRGFLNIAARITDLGLDAEFWMVCGETAPASVESEFIELCDRLSLSDRIRWFPRIEYRAMHRLYAAVRASGGAKLVTTINESFGMSVLEALISGCPVVASRVGALPEIAPGRSYLRFYECGECDEAAAAAVRIAEPDEAARVRAEIDRDLDWLLGRYSCETVAQHYLETLRDLCSGTASANMQSEIRRYGLGDVHMAQNGNGDVELMRADMEDAILDLRQRMPQGRWGPHNPAEYPQYLGSMLDQRSYQVARRLCYSPRNLKFWLRLPLGVARAAFFRGK